MLRKGKCADCAAWERGTMYSETEGWCLRFPPIPIESWGSTSTRPVTAENCPGCWSFIPRDELEQNAQTQS